MIIRYVLLSVIAYLLGSVSTGITIAKLMNRNDLRTKGSKNIGATNVTRVLGTVPGILTLLGDGVKAALACLVGMLLAGEGGAMVAGLFAVIGHNWPIYYGFRGGKGVSSTTGVYLFLHPLLALFAAIAFFVAVVTTGYVSVGSLAAILTATVLMIIRYSAQPLYWLWALALFAMSVYRHRENIRRILKGTEHKFTLKKKS